jgi:hypothetical protein
VRDALVWIFEDEIAELIEMSDVDIARNRRRMENIGVLRAADAFAARGTAGFLLSLECTPRPPSKADIERLRKEFYALPDNGVGGNLHVVLDDNNWQRCHVEFCRTEASNGGDIAGMRFAELLLTLTDEQLHEYLGPGYCGRCCADYGDEHQGQTFDNVDCRCPDCGSWPAGTRDGAT